MKKLTCKEMGGVCESEIHGETAEEMMENGKKHVHETDDDGHKDIIKKMENTTPEEMEAWKNATIDKFNSAPDA